MMLVVLAFLLGMAGLLWILFIAIMQADEQIHRKGPRDSKQPGEAPHTKFYVPARSIDMDLIYLTIVAVFFLLSGWLISALDRL
jgi:hypothetical protein